MELSRALADYDQAIALNPKADDAYTNRGDLKRDKLNDPQGALADYDRAIALNPESFHAYFGRARLKTENLNDLQGALADYDRAIALNPKFAVAYYNRGVLYYYFMDKNSSAGENFHKVIEIDPNSDVGLISTGIVFLERGATNRSISYFNRAAKISPDYPDIYKYRGLAYCFNYCIENASRSPTEQDLRRVGQDFRKAAQLYKQSYQLNSYDRVTKWMEKLEFMKHLSKS